MGSPISQGLGAAQAGLGILGNLMTMSDREAKENIKAVGKTFDGQVIYRFNYKGDPRTQIGLIAQEVERKHPDAVGHSGGYRTVDYADATRASANRGHFANGGAPPPQEGQPQPSMINYPTTQQQPSSTRFPTVAQQAYTMGALGDPGARAGMGALGLITGRAPMMTMGGGAQGGSTAATPLKLAPGLPGRRRPRRPGRPELLRSDHRPAQPAGGHRQHAVRRRERWLPKPADRRRSWRRPGHRHAARSDRDVAHHRSRRIAETCRRSTGRNPGNDFQTAGAEASLQGLIGRPGVETSPSESSPPTSALSPAGGNSSGGSWQVTGANALPSSLAAGLANWASGSPTAFGGTGVPGMSAAMPGTMQGVSVGDRMGAGPTAAAGMGAPGAGGAGGVGGAAPGGNGVTMANPPRAAVSPAATAPAAASPTGNVGQWAVTNQMLNDQGLAASENMASSEQSGGRGPINTSGGGGMSIGDVINARAMNNAAYGLPQSDPSTGAVFTPSSAAAYLAPAATAGKWRGGPARIYRAAGGMLGQSGMPAALEQPPQGSMVSGPGQGALGSPGFNNMFGGSGGLRPTFAEGGGASMNPAIGSDPFSEVVSWVPGVSNQITGHGPPQAPSSTPQGGGGGSPQKSPADAAKGLSDTIAKMVKGGGSAPGTSTAGPGSDGPDISPDDASDILGATNLDSTFASLPERHFRVERGRLWRRHRRDGARRPRQTARALRFRRR